MSKKKNKSKQRQIGKSTPEKKPLIDPKYKNMFWTIFVIVVLIVFFIVNNTRTEPQEGPYPPGYHPPETDSVGVLGN